LREVAPDLSWDKQKELVKEAVGAFRENAEELLLKPAFDSIQKEIQRLAW
jgi:hypothetical protein